MKTLVFFDINGTIIKRDSRTDIPFAQAVDEFFNIQNGMEGVDTTARSDKDVLMEVLDNFKIPFSENLWKGFLNKYEKKLEEFKKTDVWRENADAVAFIKKLHDKGFMLSLISGELSIGAKYKLEKIDVWKYFPTGGFGEDGLRRFDIADSALKKALEHYSEKPDKIIVIGDTVLDIQTARHLGAQVISITTGSHSREKLESESPDFIVDKFSELNDSDI
jgi:phosphoglycolate phosphatase-like HAD superfamily hydrolase